MLLVKAEEILRENERYVLALAHALESHKTLSGEDVTAVFDGGHGPLVNGAPYADDAFIAKLRDYHLAAKRAHQEHNAPQITLPVAEPAYAIADYGAGSFFDGSFNGNGNGAGDVTGTDDVIDFGGFGNRERVDTGRSARRPTTRPVGRSRRPDEDDTLTTVRPRHRVRLAVNLLNGSTLAGLAVSLAGHARLARFP